MTSTLEIQTKVMNIGTAIKTLRKERGISQKELDENVGLSPNALSQIELNEAFPQRSNINKICEVLNIPVSYLLFFSISEDDIPEDKKTVFKSLNSAVRSVLIDSVRERGV